MSLQKFTKSESKVRRLLSRKTITINQWNALTKSERNLANKLLTEKYNNAKGKERDMIEKQMEGITSEQTKNQIWAINHIRINASISKLIQTFNRMPSRDEISEDCGLSRQTIYKHLQEYSEHPLFKEEMNQYRFASIGLLARIYNMALNGDIKASKLFFNIVGNDASPKQTIGTQNNYIQINGRILSQDIIKQLTPDKLIQIEEILKSIQHT
jgi:predicted transcriptional regulator